MLTLVEIEHFFLVSHFSIDHDVMALDMGDYVYVTLTRRSGVGAARRTFRWFKKTPLPDSSLLIDGRCVEC